MANSKKKNCHNMMAASRHFFPQKTFVPVALAFFSFCRWDVKLCQKNIILLLIHPLTYLSLTP
jgi:hypothetical protein